MDNHRIEQWTRRAAMFLSPLALLAASACEEPEAEIEPEATAEVEDVAEEPMAFVGQQVRLVGEIDDMASDRAFELEGNDWLFEDGLLVVSPSPVRFGAAALAEDDEVVVEGQVRMFVATEIERELGWDLDPEIEVEWDAKPILIADSVRRVGDAGYWSRRDAPEGRLVGMATVYEAPDRAALAGAPIALTDVPVRSRAGTGLWVGFGDDTSIFVVPPEDASVERFETGSSVTLAGTLESAPEIDRAQERWSLDADAAQRLTEDAVFIEASVLTLTEEQQAPTAALTLGDVETEPTAHVGQRLSDEAVVTSVISDRAFYLDSPNGGRVLAIVREDVPRREMIDIDEGQRIRFDADILSSRDPLAGTLEADARQAIAGQPAFLSMHWRDVEILETAEG